MIRMLFIIFSVLILITPITELRAQNKSEIHIDGSSNLDKEISSMLNDLDLRNEQKLVIGILMLKYAAEFDFSEFENSSKAKQYTMAKSKIKEFDKDLKEVLDKQQYKVYKKHRKLIKKELMKSV